MGVITDNDLKQKVDATRWLLDPAPKGSGRFLARLNKGGGCQFYFRYTNSTGKREFLPLGAYDASGKKGLTLKQARTEAGSYSRLYQSGIKDLIEHLRAQALAREAEAAATAARLAEERATAEAEAARLAARQTVRQLFESWAAVELIRHKDEGKEARRMMAQHVLPVIGELIVVDIRKGHIAQVIDPMLARGTPRMAKVILGKMRQMFRFALERDLIEQDPTATFKKSKVGGKDVERDRVLSEEEIRELSLKMPTANLLHTTEAAIWIQLATCCRIGELLSARWEHVNLKDGTWYIPAEVSKNGKPHTIQLSDFATNQFRILNAISGETAWCYPNANKTASVCAKTITRQISDRQLPPDRNPLSKRSPYTDSLKLNGGKWTPHDLRRTGATLMTMLGVLPEVAERCLNHTEENRIKRTYQRYTYQPEMQKAWQLLGQRLSSLTGIKNINAEANVMNKGQ